MINYSERKAAVIDFRCFLSWILYDGCALKDEHVFIIENILVKAHQKSSDILRYKSKVAEVNDIELFELNKHLLKGANSDVATLSANQSLLLLISILRADERTTHAKPVLYVMCDLMISLFAQNYFASL